MVPSSTTIKMHNITPTNPPSVSIDNDRILEFPIADSLPGDQHIDAMTSSPTSDQGHSQFVLTIALTNQWKIRQLASIMISLMVLYMKKSTMFNHLVLNKAAKMLCVN